MSGTVETVAKPKSSWSSWLGATQPVDEDLTSFNNNRNSPGPSSSTPSSINSPKTSTKRPKTISREDSETSNVCTLLELSKESSQTSLKSSSNNDNDGWCTESLEVPKEEEYHEEEHTVDHLLTPGETSGFLVSGAQLTLVDVEDSIENLCEYETILTS